GRQSDIARRLHRRRTTPGQQPGRPSPGKLEELIDGSLPLTQVQLIADRQTGMLALLFEFAQLGQTAVQVGECCPDSLLVAAAARTRKLTEARFDAPEPESIQLVGFLGGKQLIVARCELVEARDVDPATKGTSNFRRGE